MFVGYPNGFFFCVLEKTKQIVQVTFYFWTICLRVLYFTRESTGISPLPLGNHIFSLNKNYKTDF